MIDAVLHANFNQHTVVPENSCARELLLGALT